jgi:hypothetical protein
MSAPRPQPQIAVAYRIALERELSAHQTLALIALAELAWHGVVTASLPTIAHKARQSRREAFRSVHFLASKEQKLVEITSRIGQETEYKICFGSYSGDGNQEEPVPGGQGSGSEPVPGGHGLEPEPVPQGHWSTPPTMPNGHDHQCHRVTTTSATESPPLYPLRVPLRKEDTLLRSGEPAPTPPAADEPPSVRKILYDEGLPILGRLTGRGRGGCAELLGRLRKEHDDDCAAILGALRRAQDMDPVGAMAFVQGALKHAKAKPKRETMAEMQTRMLAEIDAAGNA